jgi:hypothetical protein
MADEKTSIDQKIEQLNAKLTGDMFKDMEIRDEIHKLKMKREGVQPECKEANTLYCNC